jgi:hypothetical protein
MSTPDRPTREAAGTTSPRPVWPVRTMTVLAAIAVALLVLSTAIFFVAPQLVAPAPPLDATGQQDESAPWRVPVLVTALNAVQGAVHAALAIVAVVVVAVHRGRARLGGIIVLAALAVAYAYGVLDRLIGPALVGGTDVSVLAATVFILADLVSTLVLIAGLITGALLARRATSSVSPVT